MPDDYDRSAVEQARRVKLARLRAAGIDGFPVGFRRTHPLGEVRRGWDHRLEAGEESDNIIRVASPGLRDHVADAVAVHIELGGVDLPAGLTQYVDDVLEACVVTGTGGDAVSTVLVCDLLQLPQMSESTSSAGSVFQLTLKRVVGRG